MIGRGRAGTLTAARFVAALGACLLLALAVALGLSGPVNAQATATPDSGSAQLGTALAGDTGAPAQAADAKQAGSTIDYAGWSAFAKQVEASLSNKATRSDVLDQLRLQLVKWRDTFQGAQNTNAARIDTLKQQIDALGPPPEKGVTEAPEIAKRRAELDKQLAELQAPGIAAEEAFHRADGLVSEIDKILRERQASALMKLSPNPLDPANWPAAVKALSQVVGTIWDETAWRAQDAYFQRGLANNLPLIAVYLLLALALLARGRRWAGRLLDMAKARAGARAADVWDFLASLVQVAVLPAAGLWALSAGLDQTGMLGSAGTIVFGNLGGLGLIVLVAGWLGWSALPPGEGGLALELDAAERGRVRLLAMALGVVMLAQRLHAALDAQLHFDDAANAVLVFPMVLAGGVMLWEIGRVLARHHAIAPAPDEEAPVNYRVRSLALLARLVMAIGLVAPVLGVAGYSTASQALVFPGIRSLALIAVLVLAQRLIADLLALAAQRESAAEGLAPVLVGMVLVLASLPVFALIWGARVADLTELWLRFQEGFQIGQTRISPTAFLIFAVIFGAGYSLTRLLQGALRSSILPRTRLDQGGQNAIVSGLGYLGIFLAAVVAIYSAGIDLSGLAIVAGALSVGIGFGLQNVVSNFISGVILLVERPVSEGDWIEVGDSQGIVKSISVRATRIQTWDRSDVILPNSDLITGKVTNWTRFNLTGRIIVPVGVAYGSDTRKVERILLEIAEAQPLVLLNPPPMVLFTGFGASSMDFEIRAILRDVNFILSVRSEMNHQIAERFAAEGIEIPFTQADIMLKNVEALGRALRGEAPPGGGAPREEIPPAPEDAG